MELEEPGVMEVDMQFGVVRGRNKDRVSAPDFEVDLGLTRSIELDLDGEFAVEGPRSGGFGLDRVSPANLWPSLKVGLLDIADPDADFACAIGIQLGPKLPVALGSQGIGIEGLTLTGLRYHQTQLVVNLGGLLDPAPDSRTPRPSGLEGGLDLDQPLAGPWALTGELGAVRYFSPDADQLTTSAGIAWQSDNLELSIVGLRGWLSGGDRWGMLLGISPKFRLW